MLLDDVVEHRCPDFVVPQHRAGESNASMADQTKEPRCVNILWVDKQKPKQVQTKQNKTIKKLSKL